MKVLLTILVISIATHINAQQLYFPKANFKDSIALAKTIPGLAKQVIEKYKEADKETYYDNLFRFYIVAQQYTQAIAFLDSLRVVYTPSMAEIVDGIGFSFQTFNETMLFHPNSPASFEKTFKTIFNADYRKLTPKAKIFVKNYAFYELESFKVTLDKSINNQLNLDSINLEDAKSLVRAYNSYYVYSQMGPIMRSLLEKEEAKNFTINNILIKTKDGSNLQAVIVRGKSFTGKLPAVFIFNIYIDSANDLSKAKSYALAGFAGIVVNTRGKGKSPQAIEPFEHDASDGYDIIDWISKQSWSNGKVGMVGGSYLGFSQWATAKKLHPALKTIMPQVAVAIGIDYPMLGNVFTTYMLRWIHSVTNNKQLDYAEFMNESHWDSLNTTWYKKGASFRSLDTLEGRPNNIFQRWLQHPSHDSYWQNMVAYQNDFAQINIPVLSTTGYFDVEQIGAMYYYNQHFLNNKKANHYLVIGPYDHGGAAGFPVSEVDGYTVDSVATSFNFVELSIEWFNYILKDSAKPSLLKDKVNFEVMGANEWRHASSLSAMSNDTLTFYLGNTRVDQNYKFDSNPAENEFINQEVNFADRNDTVIHKFKIIDSVMDIRNAITFISQPFDKPIIVSGSFIGEIFAVINKQDMDVLVQMYEEMPDGTFFNLGYSLQRASYAANRSVRQLLTPGKIENIPITYSFIMARQLSKGSRLVIVIGVNKRLGWQINYGTGKDVSDETIADAKEPLEIKWFMNSYIKVPVLR